MSISPAEQSFQRVLANAPFLEPQSVIVDPTTIIEQKFRRLTERPVTRNCLINKESTWWLVESEP